MTALRFPAEIAVGVVEWDDAREPGAGHLLAIGVVEVPDGTPVSLSVGAIDEVGVYGPDGKSRVTWHQGWPDRVTRNTRSIWGREGDTMRYVRDSETAVDLAFIRGLPPDSVLELDLWQDIVPASFAAVAYLAPGLRHLTLTLDWLDDDDLSVVADLPALESLRFLGGSFTEHGLHRLTSLRNLRDLQVEREGLLPAAFEFAASLPRLTRLTGPDETDNPMPPAELDQLRRMLPHVSVC